MTYVRNNSADSRRERERGVALKIEHVGWSEAKGSSALHARGRENNTSGAHKRSKGFKRVTRDTQS